jgi:hypothetical protein
MCTVNLFDIPKGASVQRFGGVDYPDITQVTYRLEQLESKVNG